MKQRYKYSKPNDVLIMIGIVTAIALIAIVLIIKGVFA